MKTIKVSASCSRGSDHLIHMHFAADNGLRIIEVTFTPTQFGDVLTSLYTDNIEARIWDRYEDADARLETKTEFIPWSVGGQVGYKQDAQAVSLLKPFEVDGWKGRIADVMNHHNQTAGGVHVTFSRYVKN